MPPEARPTVEVAQTIPGPVQPSRKRGPQTAPKVQKPAKPAKPAEPTQQVAPEVAVDEASPSLTDKLKDGVVEWGIKREGGTGSET
jgi:hypothetical protein